YHVNFRMGSGQAVKCFLDTGTGCSEHLPMDDLLLILRVPDVRCDTPLCRHYRLVTQQRLPHLREDGVGGRGRGVLVLRAAGHRAYVILVRHQCVANLVSQLAHRSRPSSNAASSAISITVLTVSLVLVRG